ncbi:hypothetical protein EMIT0P265_10626 [Pseudomonas zeae]
MLELLEIAHSQGAPRGRPGAFQYYLLLFTVGASLLAKAVCQVPILQLTLRIREQARSHIGSTRT